MAWFDECPERLAFELQALEQAGFTSTVDAEKRTAGQIVLSVDYPIEGVVHQLKVVFPPAYPYFPFQVFAPTLSLERHQDPYSKLLCFVARIDSEWNAATDTVAKYLVERFPDVLSANAGSNAVAEAHEGAPVTGHMNFRPGSVVITADWNLPADCLGGRLLIGLEQGINANVLLRGAVLEVRDMDGNLLGESDAAIKERYQEHLIARWVRRPKFPKSDDPWQVLTEASSSWPELKKPIFAGGPDVVGVVFSNEARFEEMHDLWVFVVRRRDRVVAQVGKKRLQSGDQISAYLARPDRGSRDDLGARVPRLKSLAGKKVAVFGLGALGSNVAFQLARAGIGGLTLIDNDVVQAGNLPRWALGWTAAGFNKAEILAASIARNYPFVNTAISGVKVGAPLPEGVPGNAHETLIAQIFEDASLIIDCTVEFTVHHYLSSLAWKHELPYVWVSGTTGGWGGIVGRAVHGRTEGCWHCFKCNQTGEAYTSPAAEDVPDVQPVGCFSPTFTGAGFDMDLVSLMAVRLVVSTLCVDVEDGYPDFDWDIGIVNLWGNGHPISPQWMTYKLQKHPECSAHG